jgi:oligopeptide/dipeptide ABC transporter ATP-binding protein
MRRHAMEAAAALLDVRSLRTHFALDEGVLKAVDGVSFSVPSRTTVGLIGESGCGKSVTAQSILRIVPAPGRIAGGSILLARDAGTLDLAGLAPGGREVRDIRGREIAMIFQEPMTSLSPVYTIGDQIVEALRVHVDLDRREALERAVELLDTVGIPAPRQRAREYPHQLSGGMRQRAMIAMALSCTPRLLIADEPTTALDVTVAAQILELMQSLQEKFHMSMLYITHDLGVIAEICESVNVMYLGRIIESASAVDLFGAPLHPYTQALMRSIPRVEKRTRARLDAIEGSVPVPLNLPRQCGFFPRCPRAIAGTCDAHLPALTEASPGHRVRCFLHAAEREEDA